jgi:hypothetical protein
MMALELPDTKWAGVIQPDPDSAQAGEVETEHILAPANGPRRTVTFRLRVDTATKLARLLEDAGFAEIECFGRPRRPLEGRLAERLVLISTLDGMEALTAKFGLLEPVS